MSKIKIDTKRPAPKGWRKFENAMIIVFIPTATAMVQGWGFTNDLLATRLNLLIAVGVAGLLKGIGMLIANGEEYTKIEDNETNP
jgi:hypothetical protein